MIWRRVNDYFQRADDYHYTVAAYRRGANWSFQAWYIKNRTSIPIGSFNDAGSARAAAEQHKLKLTE